MPYGSPMQGQGLGQGASGQRDRIAQTLMNISQPPPQSMVPQIPQMQMPQMPPPGAPPQGAPPPQQPGPAPMPLTPGVPPMQPQPGMPSPGSAQAMPPGLPGGALGMAQPQQPQSSRKACHRRQCKGDAKVSKPDPPTPPNPYQTAAAQTGTNVSTGVANAFLNNVNQVTPHGSLNYDVTGSYSGLTRPPTRHTAFRVLPRRRRCRRPDSSYKTLPTRPSRRLAISACNRPTASAACWARRLIPISTPTPTCTRTPTSPPKRRGRARPVQFAQEHYNAYGVNEGRSGQVRHKVAMLAVFWASGKLRPTTSTPRSICNRTPTLSSGPDASGMERGRSRSPALSVARSRRRPRRQQHWQRTDRFRRCRRHHQKLRPGG